MKVKLMDVLSDLVLKNITIDFEGIFDEVPTPSDREVQADLEHGRD